MTTGRRNGPSLDLPALLSLQIRNWTAKLFRTAGEAILTLDRGHFGQEPREGEEGPKKPPELLDAESRQRARGKIRRWIRHNRATYLWTFTFRDYVTSYEDVGLAVDRFLRRLAEWPPYKSGRSSAPRFLLVPEPHPQRGCWHLHGATNVYLPHGLIKKLWGEGFVFVRGPQSKGRRWGVRTLARYISKYVSKELGAGELGDCEPRPKGGHRYWVTQGHDPVAERHYFVTLDSALAYLAQSYGLADEAWVFGVDDDWPVTGVFLSFPQSCIDATARAGQGRAEPAGGQP